MTVRTRLVLLTLLAIAAVLFAAPAIFVTLTRPEPLQSVGFQAGIRGGHLVVQTVVERDSEGRPTPAARAGITTGDRLLAVADAHGRMIELDSLNAWAAAMAAVPPHGPWVFEVGAEGAPIRRVTVPGTPSSGFGQRLWFQAVLPLFALATAFFLGFMKPSSRHAFLACLLFLSFSSLFNDNYMALPAGLREYGMVWATSLASFTIYLFMHFFLVFPTESPIERRAPWLKKLMLATTVFYWIFALATTVLVMRSLEAFSSWMRGAGGPLRLGFIVLSAAMFLIGLVSLFMNTLRAPSADDRRRMVILLTGTAAGLLPLVGVVIVIAIRGYGQTPTWLLAAAASMTVLFPLSFVYAVLVHRALGIRVIIRRGLQYALVSRGFLAIEALVVAVAFLFAARPLLSVLFAAGSTAALMVATAAVTLAAAAALRLFNRRVMAVIDRRFFRDAYDAEQVLAALGRTTRMLVTSPDELIRVVAVTLCETLHIDVVGVFLRKVEGDANGDAAAATGDLRCVHVERHPQAAGLAEAEAWQGRLLPAGTRIARLAAEVRPSDPKPVELFAGHPLLMQRLPGDAAATEELLRADETLLSALNVRLLLPLATGDRVLGFITLGGKLSEEAYTGRDRELLQTVASQTAAALDYARLIARAAEQERLRHEVALAREIQEHLLPATPPRLSGWSLEARLLPAQEVAGDFYQFYPADDGSLSLMAGDVSGKGLRAAMLVALVLGAVRALLTSTREPAAVLRELNDLLCGEIRHSGFVSCVFAHLDPVSGSLAVANAGHLFPYHYHAADGAWSEVQSSGPRLPLGVRPGLEYEATTIDLADGDRLLMLSDGVVEARSATGELFGFERLEHLLALSRDDGQPLADRVLAAVRSHAAARAQADDISLMVLERLGLPAPKPDASQEAAP